MDAIAAAAFILIVFLVILAGAEIIHTRLSRPKPRHRLEPPQRRPRTISTRAPHGEAPRPNRIHH